MKHTLHIIISSIILISCASRKTTNSHQDLPKTASVDVTVVNEKHTAIENIIVVFKSKRNKKQYQVSTNNNGKASLNLTAGDTYEIFIHDSQEVKTDKFLEIPPLKPGQYYKNAFKIDLEYEAPKTFVINNCLFDPNSFIIPGYSFENLNLLAEYLTKVATQKIEVRGYCDSSEIDQSTLPINRANAVKEYLLSKAINSNRIFTKSYGSLSSNSKDSSAQNRRTEIILIE